MVKEALLAKEQQKEQRGEKYVNFFNFNDFNNQNWRGILAKSFTNVEDIREVLNKSLDKDDKKVEEIERVASTYPMCVNPYYFSLIKEKNDAIYKQCIPSEKELNDKNNNLEDDPLHEEAYSPIPGLVHRYPDRVLFLVSNKCAMYCRFCTRKRKVGKPFIVRKKDIAIGIKYIAEHERIRDVILSGGDPLMLDDDELEQIIKKVRAIKHVEIIRIGTRVPCTLPQRVTSGLCRMLKKYHPVYINTHFNHPDEITEESAKACNMLADAGIPLGNQTVLLKDINDNPEIMKKLMQKLLTIRVKPYYIYQADNVKGTNHFRTSIETGLDIIKGLTGWTSGMATPHYVIDAPNGGGKIPVLPQNIEKCNKKKGEIILRNFEGNLYSYC